MSWWQWPVRPLMGVACACLLVASGCAPEAADDDTDDDTDDDNDDELVQVVESLDGVRITVGSKDSDEQLILGQLALLALESVGARVTDRTGLGDTADVREALEAGDIDLYWEYTGTAWTDILGQEEIPDSPDDLHEAVEELDEDNDVTWGGRAGFESADALAQNEVTAERLEVTTLSELAELSRTEPDEVTLCVTGEFARDEDGLPALADHYELAVDDVAVRRLDGDRIYTALGDEDDDTCTFGLVSSTDGRVADLDLELLANDDTYRPWYHPAATARTDLAEEHPSVLQLTDEIIWSLTLEEMQELNLRAAEGEEPDDIARDWLQQLGILPG